MKTRPQICRAFSYFIIVDLKKTFTWVENQGEIFPKYFVGDQLYFDKISKVKGYYSLLSFQKFPKSWLPFYLIPIIPLWTFMKRNQFNISKKIFHYIPKYFLKLFFLLFNCTISAKLIMTNNAVNIWHVLNG